jgi:hypothetical protein
MTARRDRVVYGAVAGFCATMAMTAAMRALHRRLAEDDRYPLPPREITASLVGEKDHSALRTILAHFGFGAAAGALYAAIPRAPSGLIFGPLVWVASYLGWVPAGRILVPATHHPQTRNLLMIAVHVVWGACLEAGTRELERAAQSSFAAGPLKDARSQHDETNASA